MPCRLLTLPALLIGVVVLACTNGLSGQTRDGASQEATATALLRAVAARTHAPAVQGAVARRGTLLWSEGVGSADVEHRVAATGATRFRIGSVSKALTAAGAARLVDRGVLDLDAPVRRYVDSWPEAVAPISIRQLLTHQSGIRHYAGSEFTSARRFTSVLDAVAVFSGDPLAAPPGSSAVYSTYGYVLLSAAMERAAGKSFLSLMSDEVFDPLRLTRTGADLTAEIIPDRARPYAQQDGTIRNATFVDNSNKWAGGGFLSTAADLVAFGGALLEPGFLKPQTVSQMFTHAVTRDGTVTPYGFGLRLETMDGTLAYAHHGGSSIGGRGFLYIEPESGLVVALLANMFCTIDEKDARALANLFR